MSQNSRTHLCSTTSRPLTLPRAALLTALALAVLLLLPTVAQAELVYVDPGHGGPFRSYSVNGVTEKWLNLQIGLQLRDQLTARGYRVGMTRTSDTAVELGDIRTWNWNSTYSRWDFAKDGILGGDPPKDDLQGRVNLANEAGADVFVSIHNNAGGGTGTETYFSRDSALEQKLAQYVQNAVVAEVGTNNRGAFPKDFYVIQWANMPAILVECAFYDNSYEASRLKDPTFRYKLARGIATGIKRFLDTKPFVRVYARYQGADRYATAADVARAGWPTTSTAVVLASGATWPDAVACAPLAKKLGAPVLLAQRDQLPAVTATQLTRLKPRKLVVLGGPSAVSTPVVDSARAAAGLAPAAVERIAGRNRYETAALIAYKVGIPADGRIVIASGETFPDAVSASPFAARFGAPILLTKASEMPSETAAYVLRNRARILSTVIVGSTSVVSQTAVSSLPAQVRVSGADRYLTNLALVKKFWGTGNVAPFVTSGENFPDALAVAPFAAKYGRPVMLVEPRIMWPSQRQFIENNKSRLTSFTFIGSQSALPYLNDWLFKKADQE